MKQCAVIIISIGPVKPPLSSHNGIPYCEPCSINEKLIKTPHSITNYTHSFCIKMNRNLSTNNLDRKEFRIQRIRLLSQYCLPGQGLDVKRKRFALSNSITKDGWMAFDFVIKLAQGGLEKFHTSMFLLKNFDFIRYILKFSRCMCLYKI